MELKTVTAVSVGAINPAIIVPQWLVSEGILPKDLEISSEHSLSQSGVNIRHKTQDITWTSTYERLVIECANPNGHGSEAAELTSKIWEKLPHTPIRAIGNNFSFVVEASGQMEEQTPIIDGSVQALVDALKWQLNTIDMRLVFLDHRDTQVQIAVLGQAKSKQRQISLNFHRDIKAFKETIEALKASKEDFSVAQSTIESIWGR